MSTATPQRPTAQGTPGTATPTGSWRHPAMDVIARKQKEKSFTDATAWRLSMNLFGLIGTFFLPFLSENRIISLFLRLVPGFLSRHYGLAVTLVRLVMLYNIVEATLRAFRKQDDFTEIPLTPKQRTLLGLDPDKATVGSGILTPPRYPRSTPTSRSATPVQSGSPSLFSSSTRGTPTPIGRNGAQTPPPGGSPFRVLTDRRNSFGNSTASSNGRSVAFPSTPSPTGKTALASGSSVLPGNRFYYEKMAKRENRSFSPSSSMFGSSVGSSFGSSFSTSGARV